MKIFAHNTKFLYSATLHTLCNTAHVLGQYTVPYHRKKPNKSIIKYKKQISNNFSIRLIFNQTYILNTIIFWLFRHTNFNTCNLKLKKNPKNASQNMVSSKILEQNAVLSRNQNTAGREIQKMQKKMPNEDPANCATTRKSVLAFAPPTTDGSSSSCSIHHVCQMSHIVTSKSVQKRGLLALRVTIIFWNTFVPDDGLVPHLRNWNMQDNLGGAKRGNPHQNSGLVKMYNFRPSCRFWPFWQKKNFQSCSKNGGGSKQMSGDLN